MQESHIRDKTKPQKEEKDHSELRIQIVSNHKPLRTFQHSSVSVKEEQPNCSNSNSTGQKSPNNADHTKLKEEDHSELRIQIVPVYKSLGSSKDSPARVKEKQPTCLESSSTEQKSPKYKDSLKLDRTVTGISSLEASSICHKDRQRMGQLKIQCSVCDKNYEDITEYTHHLNTHSEFPVQPKNDMDYTVPPSSPLQELSPEYFTQQGLTHMS